MRSLDETVGLAGRGWRRAWIAPAVLGLAVAALVPTGAGAAPTRAYDIGAQVVNVKAFGANGDDTLDDTAAIKAADTAAQGIPGASVWFPGGTYIISAPLIANVNWEGAGRGATTISCPVTCGKSPSQPVGSTYQGVPAILVNGALTNFPRSSVLKGMTVRGPGPAPLTDPRQLGVPTAGVDGVGMIGFFVTMEDVEVTGFDAGVVINANGSGHWLIKRVKLSGNYYGVFDYYDYFDGFIVDSDLSGNAKAGLAYSATVGTLTIERSDLGNQPYGIYAPPIAERGVAPVGGAAANPPSFINSVLDSVSFEGMGNSAIFTEDAAPVPGYPETADSRSVQTWGGGLELRGTTFSWNPANRIANKPRDYPLVFGDVTFQISIEDSSELPFVDGDLGTMYIGKNDDYIYNRSNSFYWHRPGAAPPKITVAQGPSNNFLIRPDEIDRQGGTTAVPAGQTSVQVSTSYLGPPASVFPAVQATGTGGLTTAFRLVVTDILSTPTDGTRFTVSVAGGGVPTTDLSFAWKAVQ